MNTLFGNQSENEWKDEWKDMPEYNNVEATPPNITATFKFRNEEDFKLFKDVVQKELYAGKKVFDGMQRKDVKSTWYPLNKKASKYRYEDEA